MSFSRNCSSAQKLKELFIDFTWILRHNTRDDTDRQQPVSHLHAINNGSKDSQTIVMHEHRGYFRNTKWQVSWTTHKQTISCTCTYIHLPSMYWTLWVWHAITISLRSVTVGASTQHMHTTISSTYSTDLSIDDTPQVFQLRRTSCFVLPKQDITEIRHCCTGNINESYCLDDPFFAKSRGKTDVNSINLWVSYEVYDNEIAYTEN